MTPTKSIQQKLAQALDLQLQNFSPPGTLNLTHGENSIACIVRSNEKLACELEGITFQIPHLSNCPQEGLVDLSEKICAQLNYLLEPISPIEFDAERSVSQNRSNPPAYDEQQTRQYYELLVRPGVIALARYEKHVGNAREQVSMMLTHEVLARLLADVIQAALA